jgi:hypothetical protein
MARKKVFQKPKSSTQTDIKSQPETDFLIKSDDSLSPERFDEIVAGVFSSKRHTGQFSDRLKTAEMELLQRPNFEEDKSFIAELEKTPTTDESNKVDETNEINKVSKTNKVDKTKVEDNKWSDCLVQDIDADFDTSDDIMEWPVDYDEKNENF